jgi:hypothetical protein
MAVIERRVVALAVGSAVLVLTVPILSERLLGVSLAPFMVLVVGPFLGVAYGLQRRLFPTAGRLFERTLERTVFGGVAGLCAALAADMALQGESAGALVGGATCLFILCVWGLRVRMIRTGRISYDYDK